MEKILVFLMLFLGGCATTNSAIESKVAILEKEVAEIEEMHDENTKISNKNLDVLQEILKEIVSKIEKLEKKSGFQEL